MEQTTIRADKETVSRLKELADGLPVAVYLRQHTRELVAIKAQNKMKQDLWHQIYEHTFKMKVKTEEDYQEFRSGVYALLISAATKDQGKTTADHAVYASVISQLKEKPMDDENLRRDLLEDLYKGDAGLDMPEEEAEERSRAMYEGLLEKTMQGEKKAMDVLLYMMEVIPEGSSEEKVLKSVLKQPRWLELVNEKLKDQK